MQKFHIDFSLFQLMTNIIRRLIKSLCFFKPRRIVDEALNASSHETYVETVGRAADTLHLGLEHWSVQDISKEYTHLTESAVRKMHLGACDVIVDITEEDYYGRVEGLWLHPWTGKEGVKAHFKFLVCCVKYRNRKYPLAVRMLPIGAYIADEIGELLESCKRAGLVARTVLFDRGFYSADIIRELNERDVQYLVFARKSPLFKNMLDATEHSVRVEHTIVLNKNKTKTKIPTTITLVKNVRDHDWIFATNLNLSGRDIVARYRVRWNIETDFRVQDEARIKSKSKRPEVRLFYFLVGCLLLFVWNATQKFERSFKRFIILLAQKTIQENKSVV
jgi:hypothetical protein